MSTVGIITNTVTWFELQPERTKRRVKRDDLDTLTEIYTGPSAYEDTFAPVVGGQHSDYNLMRVISTEVRRLPAAMTQITVNYQGKLANGSSYTSVPTVSKNWMEGEVSYQVNGSAGYTTMALAGSGFGPINYTQTGIVTYVRRYTGRCVQLAYITNNVPTGEPTNVGLANGFMGFQNIWDMMSGFSAGVTLSGAGTPIQQMACTDVRVEDRADGWYRVTETYQSRMFPGKAGYQFPPPSASAPPPPRKISSDTATGNNPDNQQPDPSTIAFYEGGNSPQGTAQQTAAVGNYVLPVSAPNSVGASTFQSTGMDPAWSAVQTWNDGALNSPAVVYSMTSNDSSTPANADVGATSQVYSG